MILVSLIQRKKSDSTHFEISAIETGHKAVQKPFVLHTNVCNSNNYDSELNRVVYQNLSTQVEKSNSTEWLILYIFVH